MTEIPRALWEGYVVPGELTMLVGHEKIGKTTLLEGLTRAMARGEDFLGHATKPATAVWASEETGHAFAEREGDLGPAPPRDVVDRRAAMALPWEDLVQEAVDRAHAGGHQLLIFDSFLRLTGLDREKELENDASSVSGRLRPLLLVPEELAVVFVHHLNRKNYVRGSSAMRSAVDHAVTLERKRTVTRFTLKVLSRSPRPPEPLTGDLDMGSRPWRYAARESWTGSKQALWDALVAAGGEGMTYHDMEQHVSDRQARRLAPQWVEEGRATRDGEGTRFSPHVFRAGGYCPHGVDNFDPCDACVAGAQP